MRQNFITELTCRASPGKFYVVYLRFLAASVDCASSIQKPPLSAQTFSAQTLSARTLSGQTLSAQTLSAQTLSAQTLSAQTLSTQTLSAQTLSAQFASSTRITESLSNRILTGERILVTALTLISKAKANLREATRRAQLARMEVAMSNSSEAPRNSIDVLCEKRSSSWLTCRRLRKYGFSLGKQELWDGLYLRYLGTPAKLQSHCSCVHEVNVTHSVACPH